MVALQAINFSSLLFLGSPQPNVFRFFTQFFYFLALIVFTYALWEEKPMHRPPSDKKKLHEINTRLQQVLRSLIFHR